MIFLDNRPQKIFMFKSGFSTFFSLKDRFPGPVAGAKVILVASGPLTNIALFLSVYTDLFHAIERIVFMGGGIGVGNRSAVAGSSTHFLR